MKVGIIGAGAMGLMLGHRLAREGCRVTLLESAPAYGGLATWFDYGDFVWDKFYHVILHSDKHLRGVIEDLGLGDSLRWQETQTGFLWRGRLISMNNHWEFATFPALTMWQKFRLGAGLLLCKGMKDPAPLRDKSAVEWLREVFGRAVCEAIWEPLLDSKYGSLKGETPAPIMWATINRYFSTRDAGGGREKLGFLHGGLKTLMDGLAGSIARKGGEILCSRRVGAIAESASGATVRVGDETLSFDRVISSLPTPATRAIAGALFDAADGAAPQETPKRLGVVCLAMVLNRPLTPYYVTNLIDRGFPFAGIIGVSNLTGPEELNGHHLAMLPRYDTPDSDWFRKSEDEIAREFLTALRGILPDVDSAIVRQYVHRAPVVQALWKRPPESMDPAVSAGGNVWRINAELAGWDTLNNNAVARVAEFGARRVLESRG